jgi:hypothetical protein
MYKKQVLSSAAGDDVFLFHKIPVTFHTFPPVLYNLEFAATVEV